MTTSKTFYWSETPGKYVDRETGEEIKPQSILVKTKKMIKVMEYQTKSNPKTVVQVFEEQEVEDLQEVPSSAPFFTGSSREWIETLTDLLKTSVNYLWRKNKGIWPNKIVCGPYAATKFGLMTPFSPAYKFNANGQIIGGQVIGAEEEIGHIFKDSIKVFANFQIPDDLIIVGYAGEPADEIEEQNQVCINILDTILL